MAFASVGSFGAVGTSTDGTSFQLTTTATVEAGNLAILGIVFDNLTGTTGDNSEVTSVSDSAGNTWVKGGEYTYGQSTPGEGVTSSCWYSRLTSQLTSGGTITVNFSGTVTAMCCSGWEFTVGAAVTAAAAPVGSATTTANGYGSVAFSGLSSANRVYFRVMGRETNIADTTQITPSTNFTAITAIRSHNSAASVCLRGEFRVNTSTGETSNPSIVNNAQDSSGIFIALEEASAAATSLLWAPQPQHFILR
jgi:hypothetical protein